MRQYRDAKEAYPEAILFFRLGDFYEMFNDDAVVAARELGLTLTSRNKGAADEVPMAGVPYHAAHNYLAKLIAAGHKVAICEQMGDPSKLKGLVPRQVVRVLTPGLLTDAFGLSLVFPPSREFWKRLFLEWLRRKIQSGEIQIRGR